MNGFLNLLKPPGMTSNEAVAMARRLLPKSTRVGHGGTLDPDAAGVLPLCVGRAARLFDYIVDKRKVYVCELRLGIETDTQDASGRVVSRASADGITGESVAAALPAFVGEIDQIPPAYSAIKRDGVRMYDLARRGEAVSLEPRRVVVYGISYIGRTAPDRHMLRIECGRGVYIRTLCHDIGRALGVGGHMSFLLRTQAGVFDIRDSLTPQELTDASTDGRLSECLLPMDTPLEAYPAAYLDESHLRQVENGCPIRREWLNERFESGAFVRVYAGGRFAGVAQAEDGGGMRFRAMLLEKD